MNPFQATDLLFSEKTAPTAHTSSWCFWLLLFVWVDFRFSWYW